MKSGLHLMDSFVTNLQIFRRYIRTSRSHLRKIAHKGKGVYCEPGFQVYNGHANIRIGSNVYLVDALLNAGEKEGSIDIGDNVFFGHRVMLLARGHDYRLSAPERQQTVVEAPIKIDQGAWIGSGSIILGGVSIGEYAVVAAGSVVTKDVPPRSLVAGNPARFMKAIELS